MHPHFMRLRFIGLSSTLAGSLAFTTGCANQTGQVGQDQVVTPSTAKHAVSMAAIRGADDHIRQDEIEERINRAVDARMNELSN